MFNVYKHPVRWYLCFAFQYLTPISAFCLNTHGNEPSRNWSMTHWGVCCISWCCSGKWAITLTMLMFFFFFLVSSAFLFFLDLSRTPKIWVCRCHLISKGGLYCIHLVSGNSGTRIQKQNKVLDRMGFLLDRSWVWQQGDSESYFSYINNSTGQWQSFLNALFPTPWKCNLRRSSCMAQVMQCWRNNESLAAQTPEQNTRFHKDGQMQPIQLHSSFQALSGPDSSSHGTTGAVMQCRLAGLTKVDGDRLVGSGATIWAIRHNIN